MRLENVGTQVLQGILLALTPIERWKAAGSSIGYSFSIQEWLPTCAVVAQTLSLICVFWLIVQNRRYKRNSKQHIARLVTSKIELCQKNERLANTNKELRRKISELCPEALPLEALEEYEEPVAIQNN